MSLKLISLNIEGHRHLERFGDFLEEEQPDVVCFQEVFEQDIPRLMRMLQIGRGPVTTPPSWHFSPIAMMGKSSSASDAGKWGVFQASMVPVQARFHHPYFKKSETLPTFFAGDDPTIIDRVVLIMEILKKGKVYRVATTHFTWSPEGTSTKIQLENYQALQSYLDQYPDLILCGDFNSPRQGEASNVFNQLAARYQDNIPAQVTTSIDGSLHRAGALEFMVDGLFTTPGYTVTKVALVDKVSDHQAILAEIA